MLEMDFRGLKSPAFLYSLTTQAVVTFWRFPVSSNIKKPQIPILLLGAVQSPQVRAQHPPLSGSARAPRPRGRLLKAHVTARGHGACARPGSRRRWGRGGRGLSSRPWALAGWIWTPGRRGRPPTVTALCLVGLATGTCPGSNSTSATLWHRPTASARGRAMGAELALLAAADWLLPLSFHLPARGVGM